MAVSIPYIDEKDAFFQLIKNDAENYVKTMAKGAEFLNGEKIQSFWHEHCLFCWEKAITNAEKVFYCTEDMRVWICCECFNDFKDKFQWVVKSSDEWHPKEVPSFRKILKS